MRIGAPFCTLLMVGCFETHGTQDAGMAPVADASAFVDGDWLDPAEPLVDLTDDEWAGFCRRVEQIRGHAPSEYWCNGTVPQSSPCTGVDCQPVDWSAEGCASSRYGWNRLRVDAVECPWTVAQQLNCMRALNDDSCRFLTYTSDWPPAPVECAGAVGCWSGADAGALPDVGTYLGP